MAIKYMNKNENKKYIILNDLLRSLISVKKTNLILVYSDIAIQIQKRQDEAKRRTIT